jgi:hypothetical protein
MADIVWEEPPLVPRGKFRTMGIAEMLRARKGEWARVNEASSLHAARQQAYLINSARSASFAPAGDFESRPAEVDGHFYVYARYLGDGPDE